MGEKMKLGILGTGMIVKEFLTIRDELQQIEITSVCNVIRTEESIQEFARLYNLNQGYCNLDLFLKSDIDTVYIALPNNLHYEFGKKVLEAGKNVIMEKPFTSNYQEALELSELARKNKLFLFEAITNQYHPNYLKIKELLPEIGKIKIVECNYSQYSSRYDRFKAGKILPAFDPAFSGGALMDINIYNIHYVVGLFHKPLNVEYYPNMTNGIDTSGILILDYGTFKCVCIGSKDSNSSTGNNIQGDQGCIHQKSPTNVCLDFELNMNNKPGILINESLYRHRMIDEFLAFQEMIYNNEMEKCLEHLDHTLLVSEIQTMARKKSGIIFTSDSN